MPGAVIFSGIVQALFGFHYIAPSFQGIPKSLEDATFSGKVQS